jgi:NAD(P)-dependent dehydrogenase (short-subunit alcohol dehydrogenase family)
MSQSPEAETKFGPIHAVVNNAGVTATKPALDQDERAWDSVVDTNLKRVWLVAQAAARRMIENKVTGSIVNIASILGVRVAGAVAPYAISKAGVIQMTKALALEFLERMAVSGGVVMSRPRAVRSAELSVDGADADPSSVIRQRKRPALPGCAGRLDGAAWCGVWEWQGNPERGPPPPPPMCQRRLASIW